MAFEDELIQGLVEGRTNIGVMYTPQSRPGLVVEPLREERLVYVTSRDDTPTHLVRTMCISTGARNSPASTVQPSPTS
ncbi:LysR substrate binding domain protein [compost metagenome]